MCTRTQICLILVSMKASWNHGTQKFTRKAGVFETKIISHSADGKKKPSSIWEVKKETRVFLAVVLGPIVRSCKTKQSKKVVFVKKKNEKQFDLTLLDLLVCKNTNAGWHSGCTFCSCVITGVWESWLYLVQLVESFWDQDNGTYN